MYAAPLSLFFIIRDKARPCQESKKQDISHLFHQKLAVLHNISPISPRKGPRYASPFFKVSAETA